jgi:hypothetical protein
MGGGERFSRSSEKTLEDEGMIVPEWMANGSG